MRSINFLLIASILLITTSQCSRKTSGKVISNHESEESQNDMTGIYTGVLPCADCPGIETTITVHSDNSYEIAQVYTDKDSVPYISSGLIEEGEKENIWVFKSRYHEVFYQNEDSALRMLNLSQKETEGQPEQNYVLKKKETDRNELLMSQLTGKKWILSQLPGVSFSFKEKHRKPHIIFDSEKKRIHGFAGCNSFFGQYIITDDGALKFDNIASTKMYCPETMEVETALLQALGNCSNFLVSDHSLQLKDAENNIITVFRTLE